MPNVVPDVWELAAALERSVDAIGLVCDAIPAHSNGCPGIMEVAVQGSERVCRLMLAAPAFAASALYSHSNARHKVETGVEEHLQWFVQEVLRFYPLLSLCCGACAKGVRVEGPPHGSRNLGAPGFLRYESRSAHVGDLPVFRSDSGSGTATPLASSRRTGVIS